MEFILILDDISIKPINYSLSHFIIFSFLIIIGYRFLD